MDDTWLEVYTWKNIFRRFDWKNIHHLFVMLIPYFLVNIGYRQYAKRFSEYDESVMLDNSDIPTIVCHSREGGNLCSTQNRPGEQ
jgi:hypothetical protein